jgi:uncharacterized membrane protein
MEFEPALIWQKELNSSISAMALSPDGNYVAVGYYDNLIQLFNGTSDLVWQNRTRDVVRGIALSSYGKYLVVGSGGDLILYRDGNLTWKKDLGFVKDVSISGNGRFIAAGTTSGVAYLNRWGKLVRAFNTTTAVESVAISSDGGLIAAGDQDSVYLFDAQGTVWTYRLDDIVYAIAVSPGGDYVAAGTRGGFIYLFAKDGKLLWANNLDASVYDVAAAREAAYVAAGNSDGISLFGRDGETLWTYYGRCSVGVGIPPQARSLASGFGDGSILLFRIPDTTPLSITITEPADGSRVSGIIDVIVKRSKSAATSLKIDGMEFSRSSQYKLNTGWISNGWHTITAEAVDSLGNFDSASIEILVDNDAISPAIKIVAPSEGSVLSGTRRIEVLANLMFEELSLRIDGEEVSKHIPYDWNTRAYPEGKHEITIVGKRLGKVYSDSVLVFLDNVPDKVSPFVKILQPFPEEEVQGIEAIRGVFSKPPSEIYVKLDDRIVSNALPYIWDAEAEAYGTHEITLFALDEQGNIGYDSTTVVKPEPSDPDNDGWSNKMEELFKTDPSNPDTDGDGIADSLDEDPLRNQALFYRCLYVVLFLLFLGAVLIKQEDLRAILAVALVAAIFITIKPFNQLFLRVPLALFLILFAPGYAFISALFPRKEISSIERFTLSVVFSIVIFVFNGFVLNYTWGFRVVPIVVTISFLTFTFAFIATLIRKTCPKDERFSFDFRLPKFPNEQPSEVERALLIALVLSIFVASAMLVYAKLTFQHEKFTALYILGKDGKAEDYPKGFYLGQPQEIAVGVENYERNNAGYELKVKLNGALLEEERFSLAHEERWLKDITFVPTRVGERSRLEFLLYKEGRPHRSVHLWVTSRPNYANIESFERYLLRNLPIIENWDFELNSGWRFVSTNENFTGRYTDYTHTSPPYSYEISLPPGKKARAGDYAVIRQEVVSEEGIALISFNIRDNYGSPLRERYLVQVLLNGRVVWEEDIAGARGWQRVAVPVNFVTGVNSLIFRLYQKGGDSAPIRLWIDDIKVEPVNALFAV